MTPEQQARGRQDSQQDYPATVPSAQTGGWQRVHPLTPLLRTGIAFLIFFGFALAQGRQAIEDVIRSAVTGEKDDSGGLPQALASHPGWLLAAVGAVTGIIGITVLINWIQWRAIGYRIDDGAVYMRQGVISRQQRKARLDRVQSIDINQPLLARLLGLAVLRFDVAGGKNASVTISYITKKKAEALRTAMLDRVRQLKAAEARAGQPAQRGSQPQPGSSGMPARYAPDQVSTASAPNADPNDHAARTPAWAAQQEVARKADQPGAPRGMRVLERLQHMGGDVVADASATIDEALAPYRVRSNVDREGRLVRVPAHIVVLSYLLSATTVVLVCCVLLACAAAITVLSLGRPGIAFTLLFSSVLPLVFGFFGHLKGSADFANFSVALGADGLIVRRGLLSTTRRVIPLDRIQAVQLRQGLLWRLAGWWRITFNIAGASEDAAKDSVLLPVGSFDEALVLLGLVLPDPGTATLRSPASEPVTGADVLRQAMLTGMRGQPVTPAAGLFGHQPRSSRWLDPLTYRASEWISTRSMVVIRTGVVTRSVACVPHARVQSLSQHTGPLQRLLGLSSLALHSTAGPVRPVLPHLAAGTARSLLFELADTTRQAREAMDRSVRTEET